MVMSSEHTPNLGVWQSAAVENACFKQATPHKSMLLRHSVPCIIFFCCMDFCFMQR